MKPNFPKPEAPSPPDPPRRGAYEPTRPPSRTEADTVAACLATLHRLRPDLVPHLAGRKRVLGWLPGQPWARGLPLQGSGWRGLVSEGGVMVQADG